MASPLYEMQIRDFRRTLRDVQTSFLFGGKKIACSFSSSDDDFQLAPDGGGTLPVYTLVATCLRCDFTGGIIPKKGEVVTVDGETYQVTRPNARPGSPLVKLYFGNLDTD